MSELRKTYEGGLFFITLSVAGWIDVFTRNCYTEELIKNIQYCQQHKGLELFAYVVMSNHLHMVASREEGNLNDMLRDFKSYTAKQLLQLIKTHPGESRREWLLHMFQYYARHKRQNAHYMFWQKTNHPVDMTSALLLQQKIDYIHENPVRAGIVTEPHHYYYSSAHPFSPLKVMEV